MNPETKVCQNCSRDFQIELEDFAFYEKVKVPPPTFCPECRLQRRMMFRNERSLYKRKCDATGQEIISVYTPDRPFKIYEQDYWWSDNWSAMDYGREYNFNKPFFEQFDDLYHQVPLMSIINTKSADSYFCNLADQSKDCYLISATYKNEKVLYSNRITFNRDCSDLYVVHKSELCYDDVSCMECYQVFFSKDCQNCHSSYFLYDCRNCHNCFGCANLRNKKHHIFNEPYSKEEYQEKLKEFDLGSSKNLAKFNNLLQEIYLKSLHRYAHIFKSVNVLGDNIDNAKNCHYCFDVTQGAEDCKFCVWAGAGLRDVYDGGIGVGLGELMYEAFDTGMQGSNLFFAGTVHGSHNVQYSLYCFSCSDLFACIGLRHKQYCILNKQYSKEEYEELVPRIIEQMNKMPYTDKKGRVYRYGEFFPPELSPFCYNETIAQEYFPLTKEQALQQGYKWKDPEERNYQITMTNDQIPDHIKDVPDTIVNEIIECASRTEIGTGPFFANEKNGPVPISTACTTAFKIIKPELEFYRRMNLPLPRYCPNCRHYQRLQQRNPLKLWRRTCQCAGAKSSNGVYQNTIAHFHQDQPCSNEFETSYAPDRPEIVYCEKCYLKEVV